jgi:hypothetical protein
VRIVGIYSFNDGEQIVSQKFEPQLNEIETIVSSIDSASHLRKKSKEKTMKGKILYSPRRLNMQFKTEFLKRDWQPVRVRCAYPTQYYIGGFSPGDEVKGAFREMDFIKEKLGVEVQFGKYAFMVYNVCAKMTIFNKMGHIEAGVEIVPVKAFVDNMSSGVSYFEQFVWDLEARGISDIDIPVLILGIDK